MYAYRKKRLDERLLIQDVMLPTGGVRIDCHVTATTNPAGGSNSANQRMITWSAGEGCSSTAAVSFRASSSSAPTALGNKGKVTMHYVDVERIKQVLGRHWKNWFDR